MARDPLASFAFRQTATVMSHRPGNPWKSIAIVLALILVVVLIAAALVATDIMKLGLSLL
jgi:hypothetical protein